MITHVIIGKRIGLRLVAHIGTMKEIYILIKRSYFEKPARVCIVLHFAHSCICINSMPVDRCTHLRLNHEVFIVFSTGCSGVCCCQCTCPFNGILCSGLCINGCLGIICGIIKIKAVARHPPAPGTSVADIKQQIFGTVCRPDIIDVSSEIIFVCSVGFKIRNFRCLLNDWLSVHRMGLRNFATIKRCLHFCCPGI